MCSLGFCYAFLLPTAGVDALELLVFYIFRTSYVHHQEDYIVHAALYGMFPVHVCKQSTGLKNVLDTLLVSAT